jgi:3-methyladenine DNA glycosylase AlkD
MDTNEILRKLKSLANPEAVEGMIRFGISPKNTYGISLPNIRKIAREIGRNHELAQELWSSGIHEARTLASLIDDPKKVTDEQMENWVRDFDSWDVCDQCCSNLFDKTIHAFDKAEQWSARDEEFVKRAGFVLMATLAVHAKKAKDEEFTRFFPIIKRESTDERNYVKKAVNWALRQIGKRNLALNHKAIETAKQIQRTDSGSAKWIASDALRELTGEAVRKRLASKQS